MKKDIISSLAAITSIGKIKSFKGAISNFSGSQIVIFTSGCMITGTPHSKDVESESQKDSSNNIPLVNKTVVAVAKQYRESYGVDGPLDGDDGCIVLEDATIQYPNNFIVNSAELVVFYDQIVAISVYKQN